MGLIDEQGIITGDREKLQKFGQESHRHWIELQVQVFNLRACTGDCSLACGRKEKKSGDGTSI